MVLLATATVNAADTAPADPAPAPEEVRVTARRLHVETRVDRKVYSMDSELQATSGSLADVLNAIPSVDVDSEGAVSLRGDQNVVILVNGKPSARFSGAAAGENVLAMPAKDIGSIEVLTTPPAEFAASGAAGIINIVTRRKAAEPASGSLQGSLGNGGRASAGAGISLHPGALDLSLHAGYRRNVRERTIRSHLLAADPSTGQLLDTTSTLAETIWRTVPSADVVATYELDDHDTVEASLNVTGQRNHRWYSQSNQSTLAGAAVASSTRERDRHDPGTDADGSLTFTRTFRHPDETLKVSLDGFASRQDGNYVGSTLSLLPATAPQGNVVELRNRYGSTGFDVDYALPLSKSRTLKAGYSWERDTYDTDNVGLDIDPATGTRSPDPLLTNAFRYEQSVEAAYLSHQYKDDAGRWTWLAGLRAETARTLIADLTDAVRAGSNHGTLYPDLHVVRTLSRESTLSFGASRRITRPDPENLNPFVYREYSPNVRSGNPQLRPQTTQSFELGYQSDRGGLSVGVTGYYRENRGSVTDVTTALAGGLALTVPVNFSRDTSSGLELAADGTLARKLNYSLSADLFRNQVLLSTQDAAGLRSVGGLNGKAKLTWRRVAGESIQLAIVRKDRILTPQGTVAGTNIINAGYQRKLADDWTAVLTVSDLFNGQRYRRALSTPSYAQEYLRTTRGRIVYLGVVHSFGASRKPPNLEYDKPE
jgi:outer membrane receptor protein involved in Fe transport